MAKISPVSIKYMIHASFEAYGPVEKPDVIGALFGQTEGLLGNALEIRDLQKEGKIGRIEVEIESVNGKTKGKIHIPTALDKSETSLIAAAIETIDRVGPTEAKITIDKIEDVRGNKREYILERAKRLLESMEGSSSKEISENIKTASRSLKLQEYGEEKLPCGDISGNEIIVVEGRADVINLLENRVNNVIGMNGTKLPKEITKLSNEKEITLFLDGDRGGKLIAKNLIENANVAYVAFAPDGKEVEELNGKEILASLRKKIPAEEFSFSLLSNENNNFQSKIERNDLKEKLKEINGSKKTYFFDNKLNEIKSVSNSQASKYLLILKGVEIVAIDGKATSSIIESAKKSGVKIIAAKNFSESDTENIEFVSF
ncbi:MAG: DNA primase DnaG [Candidatus Pacearchaeota archaeon]